MYVSDMYERVLVATSTSRRHTPGVRYDDSYNLLPNNYATFA